MSDDTQFVDKDGMLLPSFRYDYTGHCWWCGKEADSGEHKYKRTDLVRLFGEGPWTKTRDVVHVVDGQLPAFVQSPRSDRLKFNKVLCDSCNSARSQQFDRAYDVFSDYLNTNETLILKRSRYRWSDVFGQDWFTGRDRVVAYWLKHIGCAFACAGIQVDQRLIDFLDNPVALSSVPLKLRLEIRRDIVDLSRYLRASGESIGLGGLWMGGIAGEYSRSQKRIVRASSHWGMRWLRLNYHFDSTWSAGACNFAHDRVWLGNSRNVDRRTLMRHLKRSDLAFELGKASEFVAGMNHSGWASR